MAGGRPDQGAVPEVSVDGAAAHAAAGWGSEAEAGLLRLSELKAGEQATIQGFDGGHSLVSRLSALGFTPQTQLVMIQNYGSGPVIVKVWDTRIALGRGEAMKVLVKR